MVVIKATKKGLVKADQPQETEEQRFKKSIVARFHADTKWLSNGVNLKFSIFKAWETL